MRRLFLSLAVVFCLNGAAQAQVDAVLLRINNEPVTLEEFSSVYFKNKDKKDATLEDLEEYLELFINFKLKVTEARSLQMDTLPKFLRELKNYKNQLAKPYLTDKSQEEELLREAYQRSKFEVRASHILIAVDEDASPKDTLIAYKKALKIRERILKGEDFVKVAKGKGGSEDPSVVDNGGDLGFFSVFRMVYPFETAAFTTPVGEVSNPVRTKFGYHIIKVTDKREARGEIRVAHIVIRDEGPENRAAESFKRITEVHQRLKDGEDFARLALRFSDDQSSSQKGGELPPFTTGRMMEEFEDVAFALNNDGDFSAPFKTMFGWHILKRLELNKPDNFVEAEPELRRMLARDGRNKSSKDIVINRLKQEYNYKQYNKNIDKVVSMIDTSIFNPNWDTAIFDKVRTLPVFELNNEPRNARDLLVVVRKKFTPGVPTDMREYVYKRLDDYARNQLTNHEKDQLERKHPEFKALMKEYREGILLFDITEIKVWGMGVKDTTGLNQFFMANRENYKWKERADVDLYKVANQKMAKTTAKMAKKNSPQSIKDKLNESNALNVSVETGVFERNTFEALDAMPWKKGISKPLEFDGVWYVVNFKSIMPESYKELNEARGQIISDFQNHLDKQWIAELREKYTVEVNNEYLKKLLP
ncbi:MAG: peptidylprolyl isomerase [Luteibaculaceae bacterium]